MPKWAHSLSLVTMSASFVGIEYIICCTLRLTNLNFRLNRTEKTVLFSETTRRRKHSDFHPSEMRSMHSESPFSVLHSWIPSPGLVFGPFQDFLLASTCVLLCHNYDRNLFKTIIFSAEHKFFVQHMSKFEFYGRKLNENYMSTGKEQRRKKTEPCSVEKRVFEVSFWTFHESHRCNCVHQRVSWAEKLKKISHAKQFVVSCRHFVSLSRSLHFNHRVHVESFELSLLFLLAQHSWAVVVFMSEKTPLWQLFQLSSQQWKYSFN